MKPHAFRTLNLAWALGMAAIFAVGLVNEPTPLALARVAFWATYLMAAIGVCYDLRLAWAVSGAQLVTIWILSGVAMSDLSFVFLSPEGVYAHTQTGINRQVMNVFFGLLGPASGLILLFVLTGRHVFWVFTRTPLRRPARPAAWSIG